ncbi:MAG: hypothetical protein N2999_05375, partial [Proteobacteria bacterium]|nr:hypothetical protein [Pseudomonadota bacterium]
LEEGDQIEKIIIDISSGHNNYVSALIESLKHIDTWLRLNKWNDLKTTFEIAVSEPIISGFKGPFRITFEEHKSRIFFSSPVSKDDINNTTLAKKIFSTDQSRPLKKELHKILKSFGLTFSAIKNNTPLFLYMNGYLDTNYLKNQFRIFLEIMEANLKKSYSETPNLVKSDYIKVLHTFGFYLGLSKKLIEVDIKEIEEVELNKIRPAFKEIYNYYKLNLNDSVLGNELDRLKNIKDSNDWKRLAESLYYDREVTSPQKRNFFAHAGFESNVTEYKKSDDNIFFRYNKEFIETISNWLIDAI